MPIQTGLSIYTCDICGNSSKPIASLPKEWLRFALEDRMQDRAFIDKVICYHCRCKIAEAEKRSSVAKGGCP